MIGYTWGISQTATGMDAFMSCSTDQDCYQKYLDDTNRFPRQGLKTISVKILNKEVKGFEYSENSTSDNQLHIYYPLSHNGRFFLISFNFVNYAEEDIIKSQPLFDQILSAFKFLE